MTITTTAVYGIQKPDDLTPLKQIADVVSQHADTVEAALVRGGIAPPAAQDLATLAGRVSSLEGSRTTDEAAITALQTVKAFASLRQTAAQTGLSGWSNILTQTADLDSHSGLVVAGVTPPAYAAWKCPAGQGGTYAVEGGVAILVGTGTNYAAARITKNGTALPNGWGQFTQATTGALTGRKLVTLQPGDYVGLQGYVSAGTFGTAVSADGCPWLVVERIR